LLRQDGVEPEELLLADDCNLAVYHMNSLSREVRGRFTSDMGFVVDFLSEGSFENRLHQKIIHMEALCEMMDALTGDDRFTILAEAFVEQQNKEKEITMCEYLDMLEARGEARGKAIGETIGENRLSHLIQLLLKENKLEDISQAASDRKRRAELYQAYGI